MSRKDDTLTLPVKLYSDEAASIISSFLHGVNMQTELKLKLDSKLGKLPDYRLPPLFKAFIVERDNDGAIALRRFKDKTIEFCGQVSRLWDGGEASRFIGKAMLRSLSKDPGCRSTLPSGDYFKTGEQIDGKLAACVGELLAEVDEAKVAKTYGEETVAFIKGTPSNPIMATRRGVIKSEIDKAHADYEAQREAMQREAQRKIDAIRKALHADMAKLDKKEDQAVTELEEELNKTFGESQKN